MKQENEFMSGEGDAWLERNKNKLVAENGDPVLLTLSKLVGLPPEGRCLEIGCANGWRLKEIQKRYNLEPFGLDPSSQAVKEARENGITALKRVASDIPYQQDYFDVVIYGFCLYLCSRTQLFKAIAEGDRVLKDKGIMIIYDFDSYMPYKRRYKHKDGIWSYKQDYANMFLSCPSYSPLYEATYGFTSVVVMRKDIERGWPECPE